MPGPVTARWPHGRLDPVSCTRDNGVVILHPYFVATVPSPWTLGDGTWVLPFPVGGRVLDTSVPHEGSALLGARSVGSQRLTQCTVEPGSNRVRVTVAPGAPPTFECELTEVSGATAALRFSLSRYRPF